MKKIKISLLFLIIILLTGCSGTYTLNINGDMTVSENLDVVLYGENANYDKASKLFEENNIDKDKYKIVNSDKGIRVKYDEDYESIEDYILNSKLYRLLFNNIDYKKENKKLSIYADGVFELNKNDSPFLTNNYDISLLQINLNTPFKITDNNADTFDKELVAWTINNDTKHKNISFTINYDKKTNSYVQITVLSLISVIIIGSAIYILINYKKTKKL